MSLPRETLWGFCFVFDSYDTVLHSFSTTFEWTFRPASHVFVVPLRCCETFCSLGCSGLPVTAPQACVGSLTVQVLYVLPLAKGHRHGSEARGPYKTPEKGCWKPCFFSVLVIRLLLRWTVERLNSEDPNF